MLLITLSDSFLSGQKFPIYTFIYVFIFSLLNSTRKTHTSITHVHFSIFSADHMVTL